MKQLDKYRPAPGTSTREWANGPPADGRGRRSDVDAMLRRPTTQHTADGPKRLTHLAPSTTATATTMLPDPAHQLTERTHSVGSVGDHNAARRTAVPALLPAHRVSAVHVDLVDQQSPTSFRLAQRQRRYLTASHTNYLNVRLHNCRPLLNVRLTRSLKSFCRFILRIFVNFLTHVVRPTHVSPSCATQTTHDVQVDAYRWRRKETIH